MGGILEFPLLLVARSTLTSYGLLPNQGDFK
jgi:hypothetical protein